MWPKHDVFGAPLPPRQHLQPQHLPGLLVLTHLLPPRGECPPLPQDLTVCLFVLCSYAGENKSLEEVNLQW